MQLDETLLHVEQTILGLGRHALRQQLPECLQHPSVRLSVALLTMPAKQTDIRIKTT